MRIKNLLLFLLLLFVAGCDSPAGSRVPGPPARLEVVSGDQQPGTVGTELPAPLVVRVTDEQGRPVPNVAVRFVVTSGGGTLFVGTSNTDVEGLAQDRWTLGTSTAQEQQVEARAVGGSGAALTAVFTARPQAGPATRLEKLEGDQQVSTVARPLQGPLGVKVVDRLGNAVPNVTVRWRIGPNSGALTDTSVTTGPGGVARTAWTLGTRAGADTAIASIPNASPVTFSATANPGPARKIEIAPGLPSVRYRESRQLSATVIDAYGNTISGTQASWTSLDPNVLYVSPSGVIQGLAIGTGRLSVSAGEVTVLQDVRVEPLRFVAVSAQRDFTCAVTEGDRKLYCWAGSATPSSFTPAQGRTVQTMRVGEGVGGFVCIVTTDQKGQCWGSDSNGELGRGLDQYSWKLITPGGDHACGLATDARVYCWGANRFGQVGPNASHATPALLTDSLRFTDLGSGALHNCAITSAQVAHCWGSNSNGQRNLHGRGPYAQVSAGTNHTCAVLESGVVECAGNNVSGKAGSSTSEMCNNPTAALCRMTPGPVEGDLRFQSVVAGGSHTCGLTASGQAYCWGSNSVGQLGIGSADMRAHPVSEAVTGGLMFTSLAAGNTQSCGLTAEGVVYCWGATGIGHATLTSSARPVPVAGQQ